MLSIGAQEHLIGRAVRQLSVELPGCAGAEGYGAPALCLKGGSDLLGGFYEVCGDGDVNLSCPSQCRRATREQEAEDQGKASDHFAVQEQAICSSSS